MTTQVIVEISGVQGSGKTYVFRDTVKAIAKEYRNNIIFAFDGESRRMTKEERKEAKKAHILIITRQTYKRRTKKKKK